MIAAVTWHLFAIDKPKKSGDYMTVCDLGRLQDEGKPYGLITVNPYHVEGEKIPYTSPSHYAHLPTAELRLMAILLYPEVQISKGSFFEQDEEGDEYPIDNVLYWAELPVLPEPFMGDQNDYMAESDAP